MIKHAMMVLVSFMAAHCLAANPSTDGVSDGVWEGVWYRGMTSGRLRLELTQGNGTIQLFGLDSFGATPQPLRESRHAGRVLTLEVVGKAGTALTASLTVVPSATDMKGSGSYEGLALRFELRRIVP
jgi:hypothetical protein